MEYQAVFSRIHTFPMKGYLGLEFLTNNTYLSIQELSGLIEEHFFKPISKHHPIANDHFAIGFLDERNDEDNGMQKILSLFGFKRDSKNLRDFSYNTYVFVDGVFRKDKQLYGCSEMLTILGKEIGFFGYHNNIEDYFVRRPTDNYLRSFTPLGVLD